MKLAQPFLGRLKHFYRVVFLTVYNPPAVAVAAAGPGPMTIAHADGSAELPRYPRRKNYEVGAPRDQRSSVSGKPDPDSVFIVIILIITLC